VILNSIVQSRSYPGPDPWEAALLAHGVDSAGEVVHTRELRRKQVIEFLVNFLLAWSAWKAAEPLIIGRVKSPSSVIPCV
jgi:hypothetical protein